MAPFTATPRNSVLRRLGHALLVIAVLAMLQLQLVAGEILRAAPSSSVTRHSGPERTLMSSSTAVATTVTSVEVAADDDISHELPCAGLAETAPPATPIRPGDIVDASVIIESLDPVPETVAFGDLVASGRRLASCRRCRCLPACSRCFIHNCRNGICNGFCKIKGGKGPCTILSCVHQQR